MENFWDRRYAEEVTKCYFEESFEQFRDDCLHAEICFEYNGKDYYVDNSNLHYAIVDAHENIAKRNPARICESDDINLLFEAKILDGLSVKDRYSEIKPYTESFPHVL